jgi:ADP-ribose pyrophosphatase
VAVVALDTRGRVLLVQQYRHPTRHLLWELPAGLLDVSGEPPAAAAERELAEEADLLAGRWDVLLDVFMSPGGSDEAVRIFLAREVSAVPSADRFTREHEEAGMRTAWVDLDEARDAVLAGRVHSPTAVAGLMAAGIARDRGWSTLRPSDAPWPEHKAYR